MQQRDSSLGPGKHCCLAEESVLLLAYHMQGFVSV